MALICALEGILVPITVLDALRNCVVNATSTPQSAGMDERTRDESLARFGHRPDKAIDFCVEVECIQGEWENIKAGFENGTPTRTELDERVHRAMTAGPFITEECLNAKALLRDIEKEMKAATPTPPSGDVEPPNWREVEMMRLIDLLRSEEGDSVTVLCDNPDPRTESENNAIICNGGWTNYEDRRFQGVGLLDALSAAMIEYRRPTIQSAAPGGGTKSDGGDLSALPSGERDPVVTQDYPPSDPHEPEVASWQCRTLCVGSWSAWVEVTPYVGIEAFKEVQKEGIEAGWCEIRPLYTRPALDREALADLICNGFNGNMTFDECADAIIALIGGRA